MLYVLLNCVVNCGARELEDFKGQWLIEGNEFKLTRKPTLAPIFTIIPCFWVLLLFAWYFQRWFFKFPKS